MKKNVPDVVRDFPAKFSASVVDALEDELRTRRLGLGIVLDPFAGVGGVHELADRLPGLVTVGVELEPEFAAVHERTIRGDSRDLPALLPQLRDAVAAAQGHPQHRYATDLFNIVVTSPAYGNRLADQYLGSDNEKCRKCMGRGWTLSKGVEHDTDDLDNVDPLFRDECGKCGGSGKSKSKRQGYAIAKGAKLSPGSGAALPFGPKYMDLHRTVFESVAKVTAPGRTLWLVNVSSFIRDHLYVGTMEWWVGEVARHARVVDLRPVDTPRHGHGQNRDARVPAEHIIIAES